MTLPSTPQSREMIALIERLAPNEGYSLSALDGVRLMRSDRPLGRTPVLYEPGIVIVCQGRKLGFLGDEVYVYDAQHYLVLSVPLPFSTETQASKEAPLLAVSIRLDLATVADLALAIDAHDAARDPCAQPRREALGIRTRHRRSFSRLNDLPNEPHRRGG